MLWIFLSEIIFYYNDRIVKDAEDELVVIVVTITAAVVIIVSAIDNCIVSYVIRTEISFIKPMKLTMLIKLIRLIRLIRLIINIITNTNCITMGFYDINHASKHVRDDIQADATDAHTVIINSVANDEDIFNPHDVSDAINIINYDEVILGNYVIDYNHCAIGVLIIHTSYIY